MAHILIRHKVADYDKWKQVFEDHRSVRDTAGLNDVHLWRNEDDLNEIILIFEVSDVAKAKEFIGSSDLKEKMQAAGVQGVPDIVSLVES